MEIINKRKFNAWKFIIFLNLKDTVVLSIMGQSYWSNYVGSLLLPTSSRMNTYHQGQEKLVNFNLAILSNKCPIDPWDESSNQFKKKKKEEAVFFKAQ